MPCLVYRTLRVAALAAFILLLGAGAIGLASRAQAQETVPGELYFMLYPEDDEQAYACVGKPVDGFFLVGVDKEPINDDTLASLVPPEIVINTDTPKVGTLSQSKWTVRSGRAVRWKYTPTKVGDESLLWDASVPKATYKPITKETRFPVINCKYRLSIHSEIRNVQGGIETNMFYDAEGHFDVIKKNKNSPITFKGYGVTKIEAFSDGTEGDVKCITSKPGKGTGTLEIEGDVDSSSGNMNLTLRFSDTPSRVGLACSTSKGAIPGMIRKIGWLPTRKADGVLEDLKFSPMGDNQELGINAFNDRRWLQGSNQGSMLITVVPVTSK